MEFAWWHFLNIAKCFIAENVPDCGHSWILSYVAPMQNISVKTGVEFFVGILIHHSYKTTTSLSKYKIYLTLHWVDRVLSFTAGREEILYEVHNESVWHGHQEEERWQDSQIHVDCLLIEITRPVIMPLYDKILTIYREGSDVIKERTSWVIHAYIFGTWWKQGSPLSMLTILINAMSHLYIKTCQGPT